MPKSYKRFLHEEITAFQFGFHPFSTPKISVFLYYLDGLLIDTGQSRMRKDITTQLEDLSIDQICITHHHEDHTGNVEVLTEQFACPAFASLECMELMKAPPPISFSQCLVWGNRPPYHSLQALGPTIETPKFRLEVIPVPGHSKDMVALYEAQRGWLFSADLYVHYYIAYFMRQESMKQQIDSLKRVLSLDFDTLLCCHNPQFESPKEKLRKKLQFLETFYGKVANEYHKGYSAAQIMRNLGIKERWNVRLLSHGHLSRINMINSVIRDENSQKSSA